MLSTSILACATLALFACVGAAPAPAPGGYFDACVHLCILLASPKLIHLYSMGTWRDDGYWEYSQGDMVNLKLIVFVEILC